MTAKKYVVANPRQIPPDRHVIRVGDQFFYEGDEWEGPAPERLVKQGFLVPKKVKRGED